MVEFVEPFDGHAARSGHFVYRLLGVPACGCEEGDCALHGLDGYLLGLLWVEAHFAAAFHLGADVSHDVGDAAGCHHHAGTDEVFADDHRVAVNGVEVFYCLEAFICCSCAFGDEAHAGAKLCCDVRNDIEELSVTAQFFGEVDGGEVGCIGDDDLVVEVEHVLHFGKHEFHEPWLDDEDNDVGIFHRFDVVGRGVDGWVFLLKLGKQCLVFVGNGDVADLAAFCPSFDECAAHVASANDSEFHNFVLIKFICIFAQSYAKLCVPQNKRLFFSFIKGDEVCTLLYYSVSRCGAFVDAFGGCEVADEEGDESPIH